MEPRTTDSPAQVSHSAAVSALQSGQATVAIAPSVIAATTRSARMITEATTRAIFLDFVMVISYHKIF
jgi:hypothetical protein